MGYLYVPPSIDASGKLDVSADLNEFLAAVPDFAGVYFAEGGMYRCESTVLLDRKVDVRLHGQSSTIFRTSEREDARSESQLQITGGEFISVDDLNITGAGSGAFLESTEGQHNIAACGVTKLTVKGCRLTWAPGDGIYLTCDDDRWTSGVTVAVNKIGYTGRHGIYHRAVAYSNVWANSLWEIGGEPFARDMASHIHIHSDNEVDAHPISVRS